MLKLLSIENTLAATPQVADVPHLVDCVKDAFHHFGIADFSSRLHGLNIDGASLNLGIHKGAAALLKDKSPWLTAVHCFNHRIELALIL